MPSQYSEHDPHILLIRSYTSKPWRNPATYDQIEESLRDRWDVAAIETKDVSALKEQVLAINPPRFVFNIAEYLDEGNKAGFLPKLLEDWEVPHLGSSAATIELGLDKAQTKKHLLARGVPTPAFFTAEQVDANLESQAAMTGYPLIVKPLHEGGHIGIQENSIVHGLAGLKERVQRVLDTYDQPALVEAYIHGEGMREFSVGLLDGTKRLLMPIEIDWAAMDVDEPILSYDVAQNDGERIKLVADELIREEINTLAQRTFEAVNARDYSRVDLRMDHKAIYVLEINTMPGLGPLSFLPEAARDIHGLDYAQFIQRLTQASLHNHHL